MSLPSLYHGVPPPSNAELEKCLLSVLMHGSAEVQAAISAGITDEMFHIPLHRAVYKALCMCAATGTGTDAAAVWKVMAGLSGKPVLPLEISQIECIAPTSLGRKELCADILALHRQRVLVKSLASAQEEAAKSTISWQDCWERVEPHLSSAQRAAEDTSERPIESMIAGAKAMLADPNIGGLAGPFPSWDRQSRMVSRGQYVVLAGRPGSGKTALALQYLYSTLRTGKHAAIFSLEMHGEELLERMGHQISRSIDAAEASTALEKLNLKQLHIYEARDHSTVAQIEARCRLLATVHNLGIVIVDYLQLVAPPHGTGRENRENQVREMSRRFKLLAMSLPCPLMLLCQLNRDSEREGRRPRLSDLRESGAIEQDADVVWFLYQNITDLPVSGEDERAVIELIQAKRRNGRANIFTKLDFHHPTTTFTQILSQNA